MTYPLAELKALSMSQLIDLYDEKAKSTDVGLGFILDEIRYREQSVFAKNMHRLTRKIKWLTIVILILTVVNVVLVGYSVLGW